jgi:RNA polymerase primary sigma factor
VKVNVKRMDDVIINAVEEEEEYPATRASHRMGNAKKTYVTIDDILPFFPEAEQRR